MAKKQLARMLRAIKTGARGPEKATLAGSRRSTEVIDPNGKRIIIYRYNPYTNQVMIVNGRSSWGSLIFGWKSAVSYTVW